MDEWNISTVILLATAIAIFILAVAKYIVDNKHIIFMSKHHKTHRKTEIALLNKLAKDIKNSPSDWIPVAYNPLALNDASLINDKKNIAVVMREGHTVAIKFNIKSADKYRDTDEDTLVIHITGAHVVKFRKKTDAYIDSRGKELNFFEDLLKRKL